MRKLNKQAIVFKHLGNVFEVDFFSWIIFAWTFLMLSPNLNALISPHAQWGMSFGLLSVIVIRWLMKPLIRLDPFIVCSFAFLFSTTLNWFVVYDPTQSIQTFAKLFCIFFFYIILVSRYEYLLYAFRAFIFSMIVNFCLIIMGVFLNFPFLADSITGVRWTTLLNIPGTLCKVGVVVFMYALYNFVCNKVSTVKYFVLLFISITLMILDGSRSTMLIVFLGTLFVFLLDINFIRRNFNYKGLIYTIFGVIIVGIIQFEKLLPNIRFHRTIDFISGLINGFTSLSQQDPTRFIMLKDALDKINSYPLLGSGMGGSSTMVYVGNQKILMNAHMVFLQVWGNFGVLSFVFFLFLVCAWIFYLPLFLEKIKKVHFVENRAIIYNSLFLLIFFCINGLFHPLSNEWSEWVIVMVSAGIFWRFILSIDWVYIDGQN